MPFTIKSLDVDIVLMLYPRTNNELYSYVFDFIIIAIDVLSINCKYRLVVIIINCCLLLLITYHIGSVIFRGPGDLIPFLNLK